MKIALINPCPEGSGLLTDAVLPRESGIISMGDFPHPPIGLAYIASVVEEDKHIPKIFDGNLIRSDEELIKELKKFLPDFVAIQVATPVFNNCLNLARKIKEINKNIKIAFMGSHVSVLPEEPLRNENVDFVVRKEPEYTLKKILTCLENKKSIKSILGLSYKINKKIMHNKERPLTENLDLIPFPDRNLLQNDKYVLPYGKSEMYTPIICSRGCPFSCIFCTSHLYYGKKWRKRSVRNVIEEIKLVVNKYKIKHISLWDDTFTINKERVNEICDAIIKENLKIKWFCFGRVDRVDLNLLKKMKRAGCYQIQYGVESGLQRILNLIKKNITLEQAKKAVKETQKAGIEAAVFFMFGNYGETAEDMNKTIKFVKELNPDYARFSVATPYPGTEFYELVKNDVKNLGWENFDTLHPINYSYVSSKDIKSAMEKGYKEFYYRPKIILKELLKCRSFGVLFKKISTAFWLLKKF